MESQPSPWDFPFLLKSTEIFLFRNGYSKSSVRKFIRLLHALTSKLDRHGAQVVMILNKIEEAFALVSKYIMIFDIFS